IRVREDFVTRSINQSNVPRPKSNVRYRDRPSKSLGNFLTGHWTLDIGRWTNIRRLHQMKLRILGISLSSFLLGAALFASFTTHVSTANIQDDRAADRAAIRAHIERIFQAFIDKDP